MMVIRVVRKNDQTLVSMPIRICVASISRFVLVAATLVVWTNDNYQLLAQQTTAVPATSKNIQFPTNFAEIAPVPPVEVSAGWIGLFDGATLFGWRMNRPDRWKVEQSHLTGVGDGTMLRTASQFDDFELVIEYRCSVGAQASLYLRTSPLPKNKLRDCLEVKLSTDNGDLPAGSLVERQLAKTTPVEADSFQTMRLRCVGGEFQIHLNEKLVNEYVDIKPLGRGYIGLLCDAGSIRLKRIWLRPLSNTSIFNERDLAGWTSSTENGFGAVVNEGDGQAAIELTGGPGYVESGESFQDFVMQLQCQVSHRGNSGVFFRCIPGENTNGYESQIDHAVAEGTVSSPSNCGTGGIFRRKDARRIVSRDQSWFAKTIVVEGPHVAIWVNGFQVTDWTDKRKPDPNPRRGSRTTAGSLMLQGHDDRTTVRFREILIHELKARNK